MKTIPIPHSSVCFFLCLRHFFLSSWFALLLTPGDGGDGGASLPAGLAPYVGGDGETVLETFALTKVYEECEETAGYEVEYRGALVVDGGDEADLASARLCGNWRNPKVVSLCVRACV